MSKKIEIIVDGQGQCKVETSGFAGNERLKASQFIEQALGKQLEIRTTSEFFATVVNQNTIQNTNRS